MIMYYNRPGPRAFLSSLSRDARSITTRVSEHTRKICQKTYQLISTQLANCYQRAISYVTSIQWARWIHRGYWTVSVLWTLTILGLFAFLGLYGALSYRFESGDTACRSDDTFNPVISQYDAWTISGFFKINLGFGDLTFTKAKVIDILWDIVRSEPLFF